MNQPCSALYFLHFNGNVDILNKPHPRFSAKGNNLSYPHPIRIHETASKARIFLLVDLREFFSDLGSGAKKE